MQVDGIIESLFFDISFGSNIDLQDTFLRLSVYWVQMDECTVVYVESLFSDISFGPNIDPQDTFLRLCVYWGQI